MLDDLKRTSQFLGFECYYCAHRAYGLFMKAIGWLSHSCGEDLRGKQGIYGKYLVVTGFQSALPCQLSPESCQETAPSLGVTLGLLQK